jgi:hypothetical protein
MPGKQDYQYKQPAADSCLNIELHSPNLPEKWMPLQHCAISCTAYNEIARLKKCQDVGITPVHTPSIFPVDDNHQSPSQQHVKY